MGGNYKPCDRCGSTKCRLLTYGYWMLKRHHPEVGDIFYTLSRPSFSAVKNELLAVSYNLQWCMDAMEDYKNGRRSGTPGQVSQELQDLEGIL